MQQQQDFLKHWTDMTQKMQGPFQDITKLTIDTFKNYFKPNELAGIKTPEQFMQKQTSILFNSWETQINYMKEYIKIVEKISSTLQENFQNATKTAFSFAGTFDTSRFNNPMRDLANAAGSSLSSIANAERSAMSTNPLKAKAPRKNAKNKKTTHQHAPKSGKSAAKSAADLEGKKSA